MKDEHVAGLLFVGFLLGFLFGLLLEVADHPRGEWIVPAPDAAPLPWPGGEL